MNTLKLDGLYYVDNRNYKNAHLVTAEAHNASLGIEHIGLIPVETKKAGAPFFRVNIELTNGILLIGDIFPLRNGSGIYLLMPQDKFIGSDGKPAYADKVKLPLAVKAQVLRYASQFVNNPVPAPQASVAQQAPAAQQVAVQTPVQAPVAPPVHVPAQTNMQQAMNVQDDFLQNQLNEMERNNLI